MTPHFEQGRIQIYLGSALKVLSQLPSESVHCVVTSPPYWGLRDYGTGDWDGGDPECQHSCGGQVQDTKAPGAITTGVRPGCDASYCKKCGAVRVDEQIGLEATPEEYIAKLVAVFHEVRRVLRADGTCWVNMGDSYSGSGRGQTKDGCADPKNNKTLGMKLPVHRSTNQNSSTLGGGKDNQINALRSYENVSSNLPAKNLVGIPWKLAFALQADGWWLRQDIIWSKPNPMPESVTDRCTKAHEYVFLLSKNSKYYYDSEAISEKAENAGKIVTLGDKSMSKGQANGNNVSPSGNGKSDSYIVVGTRNKRSVWEITTEPFPEAHFATFPTALVRPCILAGTSEKGCCSKCGAPWVREVERVDKGFDGQKYGERAVAATGGAITGGTNRSTLGSSNGKMTGSNETIGWSIDCKCGQEPIPCTVLDPFSGSGTTGLVARDNGCRYIGIELNPEYIDISAKRLAQEVLSFA